MHDMKLFSFIVLFAISVDSTINSMNQTDENLGRIARGHNAKAAQFPYFVKLLIRHGKFVDLCGAALIGVNWILTAAHCFDNVESIQVQLGSYLRNDPTVAYNLPITNIILHPNYDTVNTFNDIALVEIPTTDLCDRIGIIPLPKIQASYPTYENEVGIATGWGIMDNEKTLPYKLQWGYMKILRNSKCQKLGIRCDEIYTAMSSDWATVCNGDSGGPLVLESPYELIGIVSAGDSFACVTGRPAIYTRVTSHLKWIKRVSGISY